MKALSDEIEDNVREIATRSEIIEILKRRIDRRERVRSATVSYSEYDNYWRAFWDSRDFLRKDLPFVRFDKPIDPPISPLDFKVQTIVPAIAEAIHKSQAQQVLEIGSGAGMNLLLLAPMFPSVRFVGLEPTTSGVEMASSFLNSPPIEFPAAHSMGCIKNVHIVQGSILDGTVVSALKQESFDLIFTAAVLEQLQNELDSAFQNIFSIATSYCLFLEEWREANCDVSNYKTLVESDYFRVSWNYLHRYHDIELLERFVPAIQPAWLKYGGVLCRRQA